MKKPPKKPELKVRADVTQQYFAAKRMERAGLLRPGTALMLYSGVTPRTTLPARPYFGRMPAQKKQTRGGGQGGAPALQSGGGGGGYVAKAIQNWHFNQLVTETTSVADSPKGTLSYFIYPTEHSFPSAFIFQSGLPDTNFAFGVDIETGWNTDTDVWGNFQNLDSFENIYIHAPDDGSADMVAGERYHVFMSWDFDHPVGEKIAYFRMNGVDVGPVIEDNTTGSLSISYDGKVFGIPGCTNQTSDATDPNGYSNVMFWSGQTINPAGGNLDKFRDPVTGNPVDTALAVNAFGEPDVLWTGNKTAFVINQGTAGASTLIALPQVGQGLSAPGPVGVIGLKAGTAIVSAVRVDSSDDVTSDFEHTTTVDDQIQQTGATDLSMTGVTFTFVPYLDDRETA